MRNRSGSIEPRQGRGRWLTLAVMCLVVIVIEADSTIVNVALPSLGTSLGAGAEGLTWIVDGFILSFAAFLLVGGRLGDQFGHKRILQASLAVFGVGSAASAYAGTVDFLITWRIILGAGAAGILPATLSVITKVFPQTERAKALAVWSAMIGLGLPVGPILGGWLLDHFWWGSIFLINVPVVAVAIPAVAIMVPGDLEKEESARQDVPGVLLSILGVATLLFGIVEGRNYGWLSVPIVAAILLGAGLLLGFIKWEKRSRDPVLDLSLLRIKTFVAGSIVNVLSLFAFSGIMFILTQYLQSVLNFSPFASGMGLLPLAVSYTVASVLSARLSDRIGSRSSVVAGLALVGVGLFMILPVETSSGYVFVASSLLVVGVGAGLAIAPAIHITLMDVPGGLTGVASAATNSVRQIGSALGVAILGSVCANLYSTLVVSIAYHDPVLQLVSNSVTAVESSVANLDAGEAEKAREVASASFVNGLHITAIIAALITLAGALGAFILLRKDINGPSNAVEPTQLQRSDG